MLSSTPSRSSLVRTAAVLSLLLSLNVHAVEPAAFQSALAMFGRASAGEEAAVAPAAEAFEALLKREPADPVLMAYEGASVCLQATTTMLPWKKMSYAEDGMALLDKALVLLTPAHDAVGQHGTPAVLEVRFVAANTFLAVPGFMNRGARGAKLLDDVLNSALLAKAPLGFRGSVWMRAARLATKDKRLADAQSYLNEVIRTNAPQTQAAREQLKAIAS